MPPNRFTHEASLSHVPLYIYTLRPVHAYLEARVSFVIVNHNSGIKSRKCTSSKSRFLRIKQGHGLRHLSLGNNTRTYCAHQKSRAILSQSFDVSAQV